MQLEACVCLFYELVMPRRCMSVIPLSLCFSGSSFFKLDELVGHEVVPLWICSFWLNSAQFNCLVRRFAVKHT